MKAGSGKIETGGGCQKVRSADRQASKPARRPGQASPAEMDQGQPQWGLPSVHAGCTLRQPGDQRPALAPGCFALQLDVILQALILDHLLLGLDEVDMLFLGHQNVDKQIAAPKVADAFAMHD